MTISVIIPAYNSSTTIRETLDSVLAQTRQPDEILVMDDGSNDGTDSVVSNYAPRVSLQRQYNRGVSAARNILCAKVKGDVIAFLDSDDLWHPRYLEEQHLLLQSHPHCVAAFTGHVDFNEDEPVQWEGKANHSISIADSLSPTEFLKRINWTPSLFATPCCCVRRSVLAAMGPEPFKLRMSEDLYFFNRIAPVGSVAYLPAVLAAIRVRKNSLSSSTLLLAQAQTQMCELLENLYKRVSVPGMRKLFQKCFAMKRRYYAKVLLGVGRRSAAREQLVRSITCCSNPLSVAKSVGLLLLTVMPAALNPEWTSAYREYGNERVSKL